MIPLYKKTLPEAVKLNEKNQYVESLKENMRCRDFIENQVQEKYTGYSLPTECITNTISEFGYERTAWVVANTIASFHMFDLRVNDENKDWAIQMFPTKECTQNECVLESVGAGLTNLLAKFTQQNEQQSQSEEKNLSSSLEEEDELEM